MKQGCALPMGPFELLDVVGNDVSLAIQRELYLEFREPGFAPAPLLRAPRHRRLPRSQDQARVPRLQQALRQRELDAPGAPGRPPRNLTPWGSVFLVLLASPPWWWCASSKPTSARPWSARRPSWRRAQVRLRGRHGPRRGAAGARHRDGRPRARPGGARRLPAGAGLLRVGQAGRRQDHEPEHVKNVTEILEDGKYAMACVRARSTASRCPPGARPCFFDPRHGLSVEDVPYTPPGGAQRDVPACALDAERVSAGAEPDIRKVMVGNRRVPYFQGGRAYQPYAAGYFGGFGPMDWMFMGLLFGGGFDGLGDGIGPSGRAWARASARSATASAACSTASATCSTGSTSESHSASGDLPVTRRQSPVILPVHAPTQPRAMEGSS